MKRDKEQRIEELRRHPAYRDILNELRGQSVDRIWEMDNEHLDGNLTREGNHHAGENDGNIGERNTENAS